MHLLTLLPSPLIFQPQNHVSSRISELPKVIPYTKFEHFGMIRFWVMLQTNKQKNRRWLTCYPHRPTELAWITIYINLNKFVNTWTEQRLLVSPVQQQNTFSWNRFRGAKSPNRLRHYSSSPCNRDYCYAELAISSLAVAEIVCRTIIF